MKINISKILLGSGLCAALAFQSCSLDEFNPVARILTTILQVSPATSES